MTGAIFCETRPAIIIRSAWRGEPRNTSAPKRAMSKRDADMDIISMAQQARPKLMGQSDDLRAQFTAWSSLVKIRLSKPVASFAFTDRASIAISLSHVFTTHSIERHGVVAKASRDTRTRHSRRCFPGLQLPQGQGESYEERISASALEPARAPNLASKVTSVAPSVRARHRR